MKNIIKLFIQGVAAGASIALAAALYLTVGGIGGAALFSVGLLTICRFGFKLYTGQIGKIGKRVKAHELLLMLVGNLTGCCAIFIFNIQVDRLNLMLRFSTPLVYAFLLAVVCGICVEAAVEEFQEGRWYAVVYYVMAFILCGARHCIAEFCYILLCRNIDLNTVWYLLIVILGNSIGAILLYNYKEKIKT